MEKWQKDFLEMLETMTNEVESFFSGVGEMVDTLFELSEEITEQVRDTIATEIDQYLNELTEPLFEVYWELDEFMGEIDQPFPYEVEPTLEKNPACMGCKNYHGQVYGGNLLVCGMHPYGWDSDHCPDWEQR